MKIVSKKQISVRAMRLMEDFSVKVVDYVGRGVKRDVMPASAKPVKVADSVSYSVAA